MLALYSNEVKFFFWFNPKAYHTCIASDSLQPDHSPVRLHVKLKPLLLDQHAVGVKCIGLAANGLGAGHHDA